MKTKLAVLITVFTLLCAGLIIYEKETKKEELLEFNNSEADTDDGISTGKNSVSDKEDTKTRIAAYICGEIYEPGVYEVESGARIADVLELCGGVTENAALEFINLAEPVTDGMKIYVPSKEEVDGMSPIQSENNTEDNGLININTADVSELTELPGIGETKASAIVEYRKEAGGFKNVEDLLNVNGIGDSTYEKIKNLICI